MKSIRISTNLPTLPEELQARLESVLSEIRVYLSEIELTPANGTIVADDKDRRYVLSKLDAASVELCFETRGEIQRILKSGTISGAKRSWGALVDWPSTWGQQTVNIQGYRYTVLGKYVDYAD
jgi:hypothetical protein